MGGALDALFIDPNGTDGYMGESGQIGPAPGKSGRLYDRAVRPEHGHQRRRFDRVYEQRDERISARPERTLPLTVDTLDFTTINYYRSHAAICRISAVRLSQWKAYPRRQSSRPSRANSSSSRSAYLAIDYASGSFLATRGDITTGSGFSAGIDVTRYLDGAFGFDQATQTFAYDANADRAYILVENDNVACNAQRRNSSRSTSLPLRSRHGSFRSRRRSRIGDIGYQMALDPVHTLPRFRRAVRFFRAPTMHFDPS